MSLDNVEFFTVKYGLLNLAILIYGTAWQKILH